MAVRRSELDMPSAWKFPVTVTGLEGSPYLMTCHVNAGLFETAVLARGRVNDFCARLAEVTDNALTYHLPTEVSLWSAPNTLEGTAAVAGGDIPGVSATATQPRATQGLLRLRTDAFNGNRRVLGHIFVPGVTGGGVDGATGKPTAAYQTALNFAGEIPSTGGFVVASRKQNQFFEVTTATADTEFAVLRSRRD
jgi:hypothetical protein